MAAKSPFPYVKAAFGIALVVLAVPVALLAGLFARPKTRTAEEVLGYLRDFAQGAGTDRDWDDFTSVPIADPALEALRCEAAMIALPLTPEDRKTLDSLRARAEAMRA